MLSSFLVFLLSAFLHEVIISIPFGLISFHAFFGMLGQVPLIFVTKQLDKMFDNSFVGNAIFWMSFCFIGQPMGIIMYYYDLWKISTGSA
jgi:diacylglycerol O-acyltransferase 1